MPAIHQQGRTAIRDNIKTLISHIGLSTDSTAFADNQTALDPANVGAANNFIAAATLANVDGDTFDATIDIDNRDPSSDFEDKAVATIGAMDGATRTDSISRTVRSFTIGLIDGDFATIGVRFEVQDNS